MACPPDTNTTGDSLHALWDMIVVMPLKIKSPEMQGCMQAFIIGINIGRLLSLLRQTVSPLKWQVFIL
ncbi:6611_t:CDS:2 [Diversispora eburnea]|uniref:6611_t:CDS:1 n=1 Tax=Diversispora eburnea TaxID=1213867 RepID=A0A9N9F3S7_9GLOM|nr:6611_t:CDS:2 [Diversispora eburnea]